MLEVLEYVSAHRIQSCPKRNRPRVREGRQGIFTPTPHHSRHHGQGSRIVISCDVCGPDEFSQRILAPAILFSVPWGFKGSTAELGAPTFCVFEPQL